MSNVNLTIGGRSYTVACAAGEENHILDLGALIDGKLASMGDLAGQTETRTLLFAALLLADELHETTSRNVAPPQPASYPPLAERLNGIAEKLENLASRLEG